VKTKLGPVKGVSFSTARKLVLALRAGYAVPNYAALEACPLIWIHVPDSMLDSVLRDLAAQTPIHRTMVVICETERDSSHAESLLARGARVATVNSLDELQSTFIVEGHPETVRSVKKILERDRRRAIEVQAGRKPLFLAGMQLSTLLLRPFLQSAMGCFQDAGLSRADAAALVESLASKMLATFRTAGAKPWSAQTREAFAAALQHGTSQLENLKPQNARLYAEGMRLALEYFQRDSMKAQAHRA
jgi:hypothetical protein